MKLDIVIASGLSLDNVVDDESEHCGLLLCLLDDNSLLGMTLIWPPKIASSSCVSSSRGVDGTS